MNYNFDKRYKELIDNVVVNMVENKHFIEIFVLWGFGVLGFWGFGGEPIYVKLKEVEKLAVRHFKPPLLILCTILQT